VPILANNKIQVKRTNVAGRTANVSSSGNTQYIDAGEFALNMADGILYTSNGSSLITVGSNLTSVMIGNTTANITGNTTMLRVVNSTASANLTPVSLTLGTTVANSTVVAVGANVFANTTAVDVGNTVITSVNLTVGGQITANGGVGTAGQVLTSGATGNAYWTTPTVGTVTSVASGNGITGGTITSTGTLRAVGGVGTSVNTTGIHVLANNGLTANSTGVFAVPGSGLIASNATGLHVGPGNGVTVNSTTVAVLANTGIVSNATGTYVNASYIATLNANSATQLATARTLTIGSTGKSFSGTNNITWSLTEIGAEAEQTSGVPRANLGTPTVREAALFDAQFTNKTDRFNINNIWVETSTDNVTWTDTSASDQNKRRLVGGDVNLSAITIPYNTPYFRIRLRATDYVYLNALYSYFSTNGHTTSVQIFKKHDSGSWTQHTNSTTQVSSWPGHLYLPFSTIPFHPSGTLGTHFHEVYVLFTPTWNPTWSSNPISIYNMQWWGGYPTGRRNIYSTDEFGNVTFPANVTVTSTLIGTANNATNLGGVAAANYARTDTADSFDGVVTFNANTVLTKSLSANGSFGTAGQVLTSGATGNAYWATPAGGSGGGYYKGGTTTVGTLASQGQNIFRVNANTLNTNTTFAAGENGQATGPLAVAAGITLTIETGARVSIV
jgi:hypothetical protein